MDRNKSFDPNLFKRVDINLIKRNDQLIGKPTTNSIEIIKRLFQNKWAILFFLSIVVIVLLAIIVPLTSPFSAVTPVSTNALAQNLPPRYLWHKPGDILVHKITARSIAEISQVSGVLVGTLPSANSNPLATNVQYDIAPFQLQELRNYFPLLGTNGLGIDIWTLLWASVAKSLWIAVVVAIIAMVFGTIYGAVAGSFVGHMADNIMSRIIEIIDIVPSILWIIVLGATFRFGGVKQFDDSVVIFTLIFVFWTWPATTTRIYILKNKDTEYIQAAKTLGAHQIRIIFVHMLPVVFGRLAVVFVSLIPAVIGYEASLVFLGLKPATDIGLGALLNQVTSSDNVALILSSIVSFAVLTVAARTFANALNDAIDPRVVKR